MKNKFWKRFAIIASIAAVILSAAALILIFSNNRGYTSDESFEFRKTKEGTYAIHDYIGKDKNVRIPPEYDGLPVTRINMGAFGDTKVRKVEIPDSVTVISISAFSGCKSLKKITIPESVTEIGSYAFYECASLKEITIPKSVSAIEFNAFNGCTSLKKITIPEGVTLIESYAFENCTSLKEAIIPGSVETIEHSAFKGCTSLNEINIPEGVEFIGYSAFGDCTSLKEIKIADSVKTLERDAFSGCTSVSSIELGKGMKVIENLLFSECNLLEELYIPEGVTQIKYGAFNNCESLKSVYLPASLKDIECDFIGCKSLKEIKVNENSTAFYDVDGVLFEKSHHSLLIYPEGKKEAEYSIPEGTEYVNEVAFRNVPLKTLRVPASVIGFSGETVSELNDLENIFVSADSKAYTDVDGIMYSKDKKVLVRYIPKKGNSYTIPSGVETIGAGAFENCSELASVEIPDSVTSVERAAFSGCTALESIDLPKNVISIGSGAFQKTGIKTFIIPERVEEIPAYTFSECTALEKVEIPSEVKSIGEYAFRSCAIEEIHIPFGVNKIYNFTFSRCDNLKDVHIPPGVNLEEYALPENEGMFIYCGKDTAAYKYAKENLIGIKVFRQFFFPDVLESCDENDPNVITEGFAPSSKMKITNGKAAQTNAKKHCTVEYDRVTVEYDGVNNIWCVKYHSYEDSKWQKVYLDSVGLPQLIIYGE